MKALKRLELTAFRGASRPLALDFHPSKPLIVLFGENGTGKTTVTDALDAVGNCSPGSLKDRSSTNVKEHLPSLGKTYADVEVRLEDTAGNVWTASMFNSRISTEPTERPRIRVLRRSDLLKLVDAPPSERYQVLRRFVDVPSIVRSEKALGDAAKEAKRRFDDAVRQRSEAERTLEEIWRQNGSPAGSWLAWARQLASENTADLDKATADLRAAANSIVAASTSLESCRRAKQRIEQEEKKQEAHQQAVAKTPAPDTRAAMDTASLLRKAAEFLRQGDHPDACPVCQQAIPMDQLRGDLDARLAQLSQYEQLANTHTRIISNLKGAQDEYARQTTVFAADAIAIRRALGAPAPAKLHGVAEVCAGFPSEAEGWMPDSESVLSSETLRLLARFAMAADNVRGALQTEEQRLQQQLGQINNVTTLLANHDKVVAASVGLEQQARRLSRAAEIVRETRIAFTDAILAAVALETNRLYGLIHPNEPIALSKLELDKARNASLIQLGRFEDKDDVPPQAYFSESHLDTLAFCFWLAVAKRESPNREAVLVLDDVFTSVDSQHLGRISQLIVDEAQHFAHVLLTTHQRRWRDVFRNQQGAGNRADLHELQRWTLSSGIRAYRTRLALDQLIASVNAAPFERQRVANEAGILLETMLDYLALKYRCRVPRTYDNAYTLGELLDGCTALFKRLWMEKPQAANNGDPNADVEHETQQPQQTFTKLKQIAFIRNQVGAHFNLAGLDISDAEVEAFANLTVELAQTLSCGVCGQIPGKKGENHYECSCPRPAVVRMLPLQLP
jgi:recombinational DNA repair ATPase RecF